MVVSTQINEPVRYYFWAAALFCILFLPYLWIYFKRHDRQVKQQIERSTLLSSYLIERFGLFIIIVLGEVIVGVVQGLSSIQHLNTTTGHTALFEMGIAISLWWLYFDLILGHSPFSSILSNAAWVYLHLPLTIGIAVIGATFLTIIEGENHQLTNNIRFFVVFTVCTIYLSIAYISSIIRVPDSLIIVYKTSRRVIFSVSITFFINDFHSFRNYTLFVYSLVIDVDTDYYRA